MLPLIELGPKATTFPYLFVLVVVMEGVIDVFDNPKERKASLYLRRRKVLFGKWKWQR